MTMQGAEADLVVGHTDGLRRGFVQGWAWRPGRPHEKVTVELLVGGQPVAEGAACIHRADIGDAGIGTGDHGFLLPLPAIDADAPALPITVRVKGGPMLPGGDSTHARASETHRRDAATDQGGLIAAAFGDPAPPAPRRARPAPTMHFVLYADRGATVGPDLLGQEAYSYVIVMRGYRALLRRLGIVHTVDTPQRAEAIHDRCLARGETCVLLAFTPPQSAPLGLRCPTVPVIAWEFATVPTGNWSEAPQDDWRLALQESGRALTISAFAATAIRAALGAHYPVLSVPTPVADRPRRPPAASLRFDGLAWDSRAQTLSINDPTPPLPARRDRAGRATPPDWGLTLSLARAHAQTLARATIQPAPEPEPLPPAPAADPPQPPPAANAPARRFGFVRNKRPAAPLPPPPPATAIEPPPLSLVPEPVPFPPDPPAFTQPQRARVRPPPPFSMPPLAPPRHAAPAPASADDIVLDGCVFTTVLSPRDGRKNWRDILTAFTDAFADEPAATLVFKMIGRDPNYWWWDFNQLVRQVRPFRSRIVVLDGFLDDGAYQTLIARTHWVVNASRAEGQCLPLVEFMAAGRPAIAPCQTSMRDYIDPAVAFVVRAAPEFCAFPHDPEAAFGSARYRLDWASLRDAYRDAFRLWRDEPARHAAMGEAAAARIAGYCGDAVLGPRLASFLGLGTARVHEAGWEPIFAPSAEPALV